jgi:cation diffusion facilitator CzcD-associated flavoprotein CzcO
MELNVWTSTTLMGQPIFKPHSHTWTVHLSRGNSKRVIHPRHIVLATGHSGEPRVPTFRGVDIFNGDIYHSSQHSGGSKYRGKKAVVVGSCNSGHDIAMDFYEQGVSCVTLVQRSSTYVISSRAVLSNLLVGYSEGGPHYEDSDLASASLPYPLLKSILQNATKLSAEHDAETLRGLENAGFKLDYGYEGTGLLMKYYVRGGGYYIDVGCSRLIADGKIKVRQGEEIAGIVEDGIMFEDGSKLDADVIVLATGYDNMQETARKLFGDTLGDVVGKVWGLNNEGELSTLWQCIHCSKVRLISRFGSSWILVYGWKSGACEDVFEVSRSSDQSCGVGTE